jgi:hypothetical protein
MSITRNRELSQFGSFIHIDDNTQNIGITTGATPFVGIGTINPSVKFEVVGDTNINGNLNIVGGTIEASSYTLNGSQLVDTTLAQWNFTTNDVDIYRLNGSVGIGTSVFTERLTVIGNVSAGQFISTVTSGTAPFVVLSDTQVTNLNASLLRGKVPPSGNIVGTTDTQTLTNKTLTSPIINGGSFSSAGITFAGSTSGTTTLQASSIASGVITLPAATATLVGRNTTDTLTNKTIAAGSNTITGLTNASLINSTISGISLGGDLFTLSFGSGIVASGSYNGSADVTISAVAVGGTSVNTGNTLVARDVSGDFTAGTITVTNLTASQTVQATDLNVNLITSTNGNFSGIVTATDFNSTSDINLKGNIKTIENSLNTLTQLRGVSFDWKETGKGSYGVIAQELEEILPELVKNGEVKSVNYNGLIGVLIEAVKELKKEIEELKKTK